MGERVVQSDTRRGAESPARRRAGRSRLPRRILAAAACVHAIGILSVAESFAQPAKLIDLAQVTTSQGVLLRVHGSAGDGSRGVPVAGAFDCDGDGRNDYAMASMQASPLGRSGAGQAYLVFGDGKAQGTLDTAVAQERILRILGDGPSEAAGSELWMDDVTGDGLGDLIVGRQNYSPSAQRIGAGAVTILVGGAALRTRAALLQTVDLRTPPVGLTIVTIVGAGTLDRLGIWMRTGDVSGDGIADLVVAADQAPSTGETHAGEVYVIRGGAHLATSQTIDLASFGSTAIEGHLARVIPPLGAAHYHFGATCQVADLDGNQRAEVLAGAALNRAGATIRASGAAAGTAHGVGGAPDGRVYIAWDDNFPAGAWPAGYSFAISSSPGGRSIISGGSANQFFGEEILGGLDYDGDGAADLFVGDIVGDGSPQQNRPGSGTGHVLYDAASLKGLQFNLDAPPAGLDRTKFIGGAAGDISSDTAGQGDFDGDGSADLAFSSPEASPLGRSRAGILHVFHGQNGLWPATIDLKTGSLPPSTSVRITQFYGAHGTSGTDSGDVLCYSAAAGDVDGDGSTDIVTNEMLGNGVAPAAEDTGNLIVISGAVTRPTKLGGRIVYYSNQTPVADVDVRLLQSIERSLETEVTGRFDHLEADEANARVIPDKLGDFREGVSSLDAAYAAQNSIGLRPFSSFQTIACDVTGNGTISSLDVARIRQFEVGMIQRLPVAEICESDWAFVPAPVAAPGQSVVPVQISGGSCQPGEIDFNPLDPPVERQDFIAVLFGDCTGNWQ
jgi:hypothetical protein